VHLVFLTRPTQATVRTLKYLQTPGEGGATTRGGEKSIDFSAPLRTANKSSDNAACGLGQVSAGFPSVKDLGYVYDITVLSVISTF